MCHPNCHQPSSSKLETILRWKCSHHRPCRTLGKRLEGEGGRGEKGRGREGKRKKRGGKKERKKEKGEEEKKNIHRSLPSLFPFSEKVDKAEMNSLNSISSSLFLSKIAITRSKRGLPASSGTERNSSVVKVPKERKKEREREREKEKEKERECVCVCVCMCGRKREREREGGEGGEKFEL